MVLFDFTFWAAVATILVAPLAVGKWGRRGRRLAVKAVLFLLPLNLLLAWQLPDAPAAVLEGHAAAVGLIGSAFVAMLGLGSIALSSVAARLLRPDAAVSSSGE